MRYTWDALNRLVKVEHYVGRSYEPPSLACRRSAPRGQGGSSDGGAGSGAATRDLEVSEDGDAWRPLLIDTQATSYQYTSQPAHIYTCPSAGVGQPVLTTGLIPGILESANVRRLSDCG